MLVNKEEEKFKAKIKGPLFKEFEESKNRYENYLCNLIGNIYKETISYAEADNPVLNLSPDQINFIKDMMYNKCIDTFDRIFDVYFEENAEDWFKDFLNRLEQGYLTSAYRGPYHEVDAIGVLLKKGYEDKAAEYIRDTFNYVSNKLDEFFNSEEFKKYNKDYSELKEKIMEM